MSDSKLTFAAAKAALFAEDKAVSDARGAALERAQACLFAVYSNAHEPDLSLVDRTRNRLRFTYNGSDVVLTAQPDGTIDVEGGSWSGTVDTVCGCDDAMKALVRACLPPARAKPEF